MLLLCIQSSFMLVGVALFDNEFVNQATLLGDSIYNHYTREKVI